MLVPSEGIICTYTAAAGLCHPGRAQWRGPAAELSGSSRITTLARWHAISSPARPARLTCRYLVNAAGLYADTIDRLLGHSDFTITPRRGELIVFDKFARRLVQPHPAAGAHRITKGVLISPTVYGNVLLGPTAEDLPDQTDTATTAAGLQALWRQGPAP